MSDDYTFDELRELASEVSELLDKPDINDYLVDYEPQWLEVWEIAPVEDMSPGQIDAMIDMILDNWDEWTWEELEGEMREDFWEWFRENY